MMRGEAVRPRRGGRCGPAARLFFYRVFFGPVLRGRLCVTLVAVDLSHVSSCVSVCVHADVTGLCDAAVPTRMT